MKTLTTKRYGDGVRQSDWPPFSGRLWQRNYWEHIIRDDSELDLIREYIQNNPAQWELDQLYVKAGATYAKGNHGGLPLRVDGRCDNAK
ncbi:hypothetical protein [Sedimenticola sp.]|uniref:hypothetical protein n=1 Tax=Sedimenticola sp. TaxID=1940285 RepID=UPI003D0DA3AA